MKNGGEDDTEGSRAKSGIGCGTIYIAISRNDQLILFRSSFADYQLRCKWKMAEGPARRLHSEGGCREQILGIYRINRLRHDGVIGLVGRVTPSM